MKFRTEYLPSRAPITLDPSRPVVLIGSCFTQNMAAQMEGHGWNAKIPFGILYNPLSMALAISILKDTQNSVAKFENSLFESRGLWHSHLFDSSFSSSRREDCILHFKNKRAEFLQNLEEGRTLIVTFGTSICYFLEKEKIPVGNCHKQPSQLYYKERLTQEEITGYWHSIIKGLTADFPGLNVIFTVSPVRHLKDGFVGNSRSKAVLALAIEDICNLHENAYYFPAYEILNDDLRDYRFYTSDLAHPSEEAIEYIWGNFVATYIDEVGLNYLQEGRKAYLSLHHRPLTGALGKPLNTP